MPALEDLSKRALMRQFLLSDSAALWVGRITLGAIAGSVLLVVIAMLYSTESSGLGHGGVFIGGAFGLVVIAWSVAHLAMVWHREQAGYVSEADVAEWEARRTATKRGFVVPFTYLLASPQQRSVLRYLGKRKPGTTRPWYWPRS